MAEIPLDVLEEIWATAEQPTTIHTTCAWPGCTRTSADGMLVRANPKGERGIWMCPEDAKAYRAATPVTT